jgi:glycosyltransferase involved in cell wall biosynthesis
MTSNEIQDALPEARVIFNPIREISVRKSPIPAAGTIRMAMVSRLETAVKCQDLAINTLAQEAFRDIDFILDIFGEGPDRSYLEDLIRFHRLEKKVRLFLQVLEQSDL